MRVLITGVAGFIGSRLAQRLADAGHEVVGIDDLSAGVDWQIPADVDFVQHDICTPLPPAAMNGIDAVYHLAAFSSVVGCQREPALAAKIHCQGTANVLEAMTRYGIRRVIAAETSAVYEGTNLYPTPESEDSPRTIYAITKRCAGRLIHAYANDHDLKATTLRYFNVYGPHQDYRREVSPVMSAFIRAALSGTNPTIFGDGTKTRDFIHVDDLNSFHELLLCNDASVGGTYNVGSGTEISVSDVLRLVENATGTSLTPTYAPELESEAPRTLADISCAKALGWEPAVSIEDGIASCVAFLRAELQAGRLEPS